MSDTRPVGPSHNEPFIGREYYDDFNRAGASISVTGLRIGRRRYRVEVSRAGIYLRLGPIEFSAGPSYGDDQR